MADRYEIMAAYTLARKVDMANTFRYKLAHNLQRWNPSTGTELLFYSDYGTGKVHGETEEMRSPTTQELLTLNEQTKDGFQHEVIIAQTVIAAPDFYNKAIAGVSSVNVSMSDLISDTQVNNQAISYMNSNISASEASMSDVGYYIEELDVAQINPITPMPWNVKAVNEIHDLVEAMMYEMAGQNSHSGVAQYKNANLVKAQLNQRLKTVYSCNVGSHLAGGDSDMEDDIALLQSLISYIQSNYLSANNMNDFKAMSDYVRNAIPCLTTCMRYWSF